MADTKITGLSATTTPQDTDLVMVVDTSDTTMNADGTNTKMTVANLLGGTTQTEMGYVAGLNADAQTQFDAIGAASGTFINTTGNAIANGVTATTQSSSDNSTKIATTAYVDAAAAGGDVGSLSVCTGRITGETAKYVSTTDQASCSTVYFCGPTGGSWRTWLWNGASYVETVYSQLSLPMTGASAGYPYDIFVEYNSGIPILSSSPWSNATTRMTALTMDSLGIIHLTGSQAKRYLGTIHIHTSSTFRDVVYSRGIWNYYNRVPRELLGDGDGTSNWYLQNVDVVRAANANTTLGDMRVDWIRGLDDGEPVELEVRTVCNVGGGFPWSWSWIGIGIDSTTVNSADINQTVHAYQSGSGGANSYIVGTALYSGYPGLGQHYGQWIESPHPGQVGGTKRGQWFGESAGIYKFGISGKVWC